MISKNHYQNEIDMPLGISMAVAQNPLTLKMFTDLTPAQRESLVSSPDAGDVALIMGGSRSHRDFHIYD